MLNWISKWFVREQEFVNLIYNGPVESLLEFDVPHIYHHLKPGSELLLHLEGAVNQERIAVYYKQFKLGYIPTAYSPVLTELLQRGFFLKSKISKVLREKYLPTEHIEISITDQITQA